MPELRPCGTRAAYLRHLRRGETPDEACAAASRNAKNARMAARRQKSNEAVVTAIASAPPIVGDINELDEVLDTLRIVKATMLAGPPSTIAALSKRYEELVAHAIRLQKAAAKPKENALDELARRRAERLSRG